MSNKDDVYWLRRHEEIVGFLKNNNIKHDLAMWLADLKIDIEKCRELLSI